jgi:tRNA modification GTPase
MPVSLNPADTIAALASAPGSAARGIIRLSGPAAPDVAGSIFTADCPAPPDAPANRAICLAGRLKIAALARPIPADLYLWRGRRSYTGQPLAELHTLGSPPVLEAILAELLTRGARPAQAGEFTLRAFLAGRLDLTQAEAVLGVIDARDERELKTALAQLAGGLASRLVQLRGDLLDLLADLEAGLDFADEHIEFVSHATLVGRLGLARDLIDELLSQADRRMRSSVRPRVVLAGPPNAGKSTLFNALAGAPAALVSSVAGTTRDYLVREATLQGLAVELVDTAGEESAVGGISQHAQQLRSQQILSADLVVMCRAADQAAQPPTDFGGIAPERVLAVVTKADLARGAPTAAGQLAVSAPAGTGIGELVAAIASRLAGASAGEASLLGMTAARSEGSLHGARAALERAVGIARSESDQELLAIEIREALDELGRIAGDVYTDDILDRIFSRFCIGK